MQALSLQKMGILPDKFVLLKITKAAAVARMKQNLIAIKTDLYGQELEDLAAQSYQEYELHMTGVKAAFNQFIFEHACDDGKTAADITAELKKMLDLRFQQDAPRRPPRILIMGPPGAGRTT